MKIDRKRTFDAWALFCHAIRTGSVTGAAAQAGIDGAQASRRLRELEAAVGQLLGVDELDIAVVLLRLLVHHLKDALRAGKGRQQKIDLLGELVHGHGALAHINQIGSKASQIHQAGKNKHASHAGRYRIIKVGKADDGGHHHAGIGHGLGG